jgi:2-aminoethylphosphonate-pyruvate transaminase
MSSATMNANNEVDSYHSFDLHSVVAIKNRKAILTPGPGSLLPENLIGIVPCFGRGDPEYQAIETRVLTSLRRMTGHERIARMQGSASLALEIAIRNFVAGRTLLIDTGYYAQRLAGFCRSALSHGAISSLDVVPFSACESVHGYYDWIVTVFTETSTGLLNDIRNMRALAERVGARLMVDATGSIGLQDGHELANVIAYSSCKGLFGLTGASFVAYNSEPEVEETSFFLSLTTHVEHKVTGPYHAICALDQVLSRHSDLRESVRIGKDVFCKRFADRLVRPADKQPLLCTLLRGTVKPLDDYVVLYQPRSIEPGTSVVCHIGEGHLGRKARGDIYARIEVVD